MSISISRSYWLVSLLLLSSFRSAPPGPPEAFINHLKEAKLRFTPPKGMESVPCQENAQMFYEYALRYPGDSTFEVRYTILPLDPFVRDSSEMTHDQFSKAFFQATMLNIEMGGPANYAMPKVSYFDPKAVKKEFGADWGCVSVVQLGPEFGGTTFTHCLAIMIHKEKVGDAFMFYLSNKPQEIEQLMTPAFHSLGFK